MSHPSGGSSWATGVVASGRTEPPDGDLDAVVGSWPADPDLLGWFETGLAELVATLSRARPDLRCWTFLPAPSPVAFWARRQAHETAMHRVDAELAAGAVPVFAPSFAADGIDELLSGFITRPNGRLRSDADRTLRVRCTDTLESWLVRISSNPVETTRDAGRADCEVAGRASDLSLALWNRQSNAALTIEGDRQVLDLFLDRVHIRWR